MADRRTVAQVSHTTRAVVVVVVVVVAAATAAAVAAEAVTAAEPHIARLMGNTHPTKTLAEAADWELVDDSVQPEEGSRRTIEAGTNSGRSEGWVQAVMGEPVPPGFAGTTARTRWGSPLLAVEKQAWAVQAVDIHIHSAVALGELAASYKNPWEASAAVATVPAEGQGGNYGEGAAGGTTGQDMSFAVVAHRIVVAGALDDLGSADTLDNYRGADHTQVGRWTAAMSLLDSEQCR